MSVEDARDAVIDAVETWSNNVNLTTALACDAALDRLILEVQAEMPCYGPFWCDKDVAPAANSAHAYIEFDEGPCPSCRARMKLKETADAPSA